MTVSWYRKVELMYMVNIVVFNPCGGTEKGPGDSSNT